MATEKMRIEKCATCKTWEPFNAVCYNENSPHHADIMDRDKFCAYWTRNECTSCGGLLEARESNGKIWYHCYGCHFEHEAKSYDDRVKDIRAGTEELKAEIRQFREQIEREEAEIRRLHSQIDALLGHDMV